MSGRYIVVDVKEEEYHTHTHTHTHTNNSYYNNDAEVIGRAYII